jgi:hypothetical protein
MVRVFVEARPKGRPEGSPIEDYVVEDHADHVIQKDPARSNRMGEEDWAHAACRSRPAPERQGKARSLAHGLGFASTPDASATDLTRVAGSPPWPSVDNGAVVRQKGGHLAKNNPALGRVKSDDGGSRCTERCVGPGRL